MSRAALLLTGLGAAALAVGCADPAGPKAFTQGDAGMVAVAPAEAAWGLDDLAAVLAATVDEDRRIDPTALHTMRPRLERQLALLARPWPADIAQPDAGNPRRVAWLYNARTAWSLWLISARLERSLLRRDIFILPESVDAPSMANVRFGLNGGEMTLAGIDAELARHDDWRVGASAPGAIDWMGPLPIEPFSPESVTALLDERFAAYGRSDDRLVTDHDYQQLKAPPALWVHADRIRRDYADTYQLPLEAVSLQTALRPWLGPRGRDRMNDALGYEPVVRTGAAGVVARSEEPLSQW